MPAGRLQSLDWTGPVDWTGGLANIVAEKGIPDMSQRRRSDVPAMALRRRSDVAAMALRRRSDVAAMPLRWRSDVQYAHAHKHVYGPRLARKEAGLMEEPATSSRRVTHGPDRMSL